MPRRRPSNVGRFAAYGSGPIGPRACSPFEPRAASRRISCERIDALRPQHCPDRETVLGQSGTRVGRPSVAARAQPPRRRRTSHALPARRPVGTRRADPRGHAVYRLGLQPRRSARADRLRRRREPTPGLTTTADAAALGRITALHDATPSGPDSATWPRAALGHRRRAAPHVDDPRSRRPRAPVPDRPRPSSRRDRAMRSCRPRRKGRREALPHAARAWGKEVVAVDRFELST